MLEKLEDKAQEEYKKYRVHLRYIGVIALIVLFFICKDFFRKGHENNLFKDAITYKDSARHYKGKYDSVATNQALVLDNQKQIKTYLSAISDTMKTLLEKYKKITAAVNTKEYYFYRDSIHFLPQQIPCEFKPFDIVKREKFFIFKGTLAHADLIIDSLFIPNTQSIVVGQKKTGFLKREYTIDVVNSNPHIQVTNLGAYTVTTKPKWYERPSVWGLAGLVMGFATSVATGR